VNRKQENLASGFKIEYDIQVKQDEKSMREEKKMKSRKDVSF